jgi:hypothetical protein
MLFSLPFFHRQPRGFFPSATERVGDILARLQQDAGDLQHALASSSPAMVRGAADRLQEFGIRPELAALAIGKAAMSQARRHPSLVGSLVLAGAVAGIAYALSRPPQQIYAPHVVRRRESQQE